MNLSSPFRGTGGFYMDIAVYILLLLYQELFFLAIQDFFFQLLK